MIKEERGRLYFAVAILLGSAIGAGVLGIPYIAAQSGFLIALAYIFVLGLTVLLVNLYLGEVSLRTKEDHQIAGYAEKYLGKRGRRITQIAVVLGIYASLIAYMIGIGQSLSFLIFENLSRSLLLSILTGLVMSAFLFGGLKTLKNFEKIGVTIILFLLALIFLIFFKDVQMTNLAYINTANLFLPFGVILFSFMCFHSIPEVRLVLKNRKKLIKPSIIIAAVVGILFYSIFAFIITGSQGLNTPQIATLGLGKIFIGLGILTMFTSYLAVGNALLEDFEYDEKMTKRKSWFLAAIFPIILFVLIQLVASEFLSFTRILSIGGVLSGGTIAIVSLLMVKKAKKHADRRPEYSIPINKFIVGALVLIFLVGVIIEIIKYI